MNLDEIQKYESELTLANIKLDDARREKSTWIVRVDDLNEKLKTAQQRISE